MFQTPKTASARYTDCNWSIRRSMAATKTQPRHAFRVRIFASGPGTQILKHLTKTERISARLSAKLILLFARDGRLLRPANDSNRMGLPTLGAPDSDYSSYAWFEHWAFPTHLILLHLLDFTLLRSLTFCHCDSGLVIKFSGFFLFSLL